MEDLERLFNPRSIAIIGASTDPKSVGHLLVKNLQDEAFPGKIFPVNPKATTLLGLHCYSAIQEIKEPIDLAILAVPAKITPTLLEEVGKQNIKNAVIIAAGFKEVGGSGKKLEEEIIALAEQYGISILGPNCLGFLNPRRSLNASFAKGLPGEGAITFLSQSGALLTTLLDQTRDTLGYAHMVSIGNKALLDENDLISYFLTDQETELIAFYTEGLTESKRLRAVGEEALRKRKPVPLIALKSGNTEAGATASSSHTGALAGTEKSYRALFHQARIVQAHSFAHLVELLEVFSKNPLPKNNRVAIVTNAGGLGVLATDCAVQAGLKLAPLSEKTKKRLALLLPPSGSLANPIDIIGDALADRYQGALECVADDPNVDMLLIIVTPQAMTEGEKTAEVIAHLRARSDKPIVVVMPEGPLLESGRVLLRSKKIALLNYPENAARALGNLAQIEKWQSTDDASKFLEYENDRTRAREIIEAAKSQTRAYLSPEETQAFLECYGFQFPKTRLATSTFEATRLAKEFPHPVVLKIASPDIIHKSDAGGVLLDVQPEELGRRYEELVKTVQKRLPEAKIDGVTISEMAQPGGLEMLLGLKQESGLGTLIVIGLGGIFVEVLEDTSMRFAPLAYHDTEEMLQELKSLPLLLGTRGRPGVHLAAIKQSLKALSDIAEDFPEILELDVNPLLAFPEAKDFRALDARIRISQNS